MTDADPEGVTVTADGIAVRKTVDTEQFQTLAVVLELASDRDDVARVQLVDQIPSDVSMEDVGFHPDYGSEYWSVEEGTVAFERDLEPGERYTTVYGIRDFPEDEASVLLGEPQIGLIDADQDGLDDVIDKERSQVVREFLSGEADLPGLEADIVADADEAAEPAAPSADPVEATSDATATASAGSGSTAEQPPAGQPAESAPDAPPVAAAGGEPTDDGAAGDDAREVRVPLTGGVVRVLIKELREGDLDPEDRRMLREALLDTEASTEARLGHLQQRVSDLEAYADALEAFIDEEGTAEAIITDLRDNVASLERTVLATDDRMDEVLDELDAVDDRLESVADDVATVESRGEVLADRVEDLEDDVDGVDQQVADVGARVDQVSTDLDAVDDRTGDLDTRIEDLRDEVAALRRDLREDLDAVADDLQDFEAFRERLSSVFGGAGAAVDDANDE